MEAGLGSGSGSSSGSSLPHITSTDQLDEGGRVAPIMHHQHPSLASALQVQQQHQPAPSLIVSHNQNNIFGAVRPSVHHCHHHPHRFALSNNNPDVHVVPYFFQSNPYSFQQQLHVVPNQRPNH